jgi:glycosyltransferase involved in cell wall biosynthesis
MGTDEVKHLAIVPAFNEEASIGAIIDEIRAKVPSFDVAVIDDGSQDATREIARSKGAIVLPLPYNLGIGGAVQAGFLYAARNGYDVAVQIDGDGQHDPGQVRFLLEALVGDQVDVVIGSRYVGGGTFEHAAHRRFLIGVFARIVTLATGQRFTDTSSSFRAYNRRAIEFCADDYPHGFLESVESTVTLTRSGLRLVEVPVIIRQREAGESTLSLGRTMVYSVKVSIAIALSLLHRRPRR